MPKGKNPRLRTPSASPAEAVDRRSEILAKAKDIFLRYGYKKSTVEDIASACGLGKAALYHYFASKEAILAEVVNVESERMIESLRALANRATDARSRFVALMTSRSALVRQTMIDYGVRPSLLREVLPVVYQMRQRFQRREEQLFAEVIEQGQREGEFKACNAQSCARALVAATHGLDLHYLQLGAEGKLDASVRDLAQLLCDGLCR